MRGDWKDDAMRFEDIDKAVMRQLRAYTYRNLPATQSPRGWCVVGKDTQRAVAAYSNGVRTERTRD